MNQSTGVVNELSGITGRGGARRVEDLLLADVHEFKVEIWDDRLEQFVSPSHNFSRQIEVSGGGTEFVTGQYHAERRINTNFGPLGNAVPGRNNVFDTWNPNVFDHDFNGVAGIQADEQSAPFMPYRYAPPRASDPGLTAGATFTAPNGPGPSPDTMTNPYEDYDIETGETNRNKGFWIPSDFSDALPANWTYQNYSEGDVVFAVPATFADDPNVTGWDADTDGVFEWGEDQNANATVAPFDPLGAFPGQGFAIAYRCVAAGYAGATVPSFPRVPGQVFAETATVGASGDPAEWVSIDNRRPLRAIKITVQFYDEGTENLRQLSLVLPLTTDR